MCSWLWSFGLKAGKAAPPLWKQGGRNQPAPGGLHFTGGLHFGLLALRGSELPKAPVGEREAEKGQSVYIGGGGVAAQAVRLPSSLATATRPVGHLVWPLALQSQPLGLPEQWKKKHLAC